MARDGADYPEETMKRRGPLGLWASALFNICMVVLPLAGAYAALVVTRDHLYTYAPTQGAARATREALDSIAARLPGAENKRDRWDDYVATALMLGDIQAARGLMLSSRAMLGPGDASRINRAASGAGDADIEAGALDLLTPGTRARYEARVPLLSRRASVATTSVAAQPFIVVGDAADFEAAALEALNNPESDHLEFVLMGLGVVLAGQNPPEALAGASMLQAALAAERLPSELHAALAARAEAVLPRARFRTEVARRAAGGAPPDERNALLQDAFRGALAPAELERFHRLLSEIGAIGAAATPQGALMLLSRARGLGDLPRLRLIAETNPERGVAMARFAPREIPLPEAGRGQLRITTALAAPLAIAALAFVLLGFAALATTAQAVGRAMDDVRIFQPPRAAAPPRRASRLVRAFDA